MCMYCSPFPVANMLLNSYCLFVWNTKWNSTLTHCLHPQRLAVHAPSNDAATHSTHVVLSELIAYINLTMVMLEYKVSVQLAPNYTLIYRPVNVNVYLILCIFEREILCDCMYNVVLSFVSIFWVYLCTTRCTWLKNIMYGTQCHS